MGGKPGWAHPMKGQYKVFLEEREGRAVVVAAPTFRHEIRDTLALEGVQDPK